MSPKPEFQYKPFFSLARLPLRIKLTLGIVVPLTLILGAFTGIEYTHHRQAVLANLSLLAAHSSHVIEDNLRQQMLRSNFAELQALLDSINTTGDFRLVYLLDPSGTVIFAPEGKGVGNRLSNLAPDCQPCHKLAPSQRPSSVVVTTNDGERVFRSMNPIENSPECSHCHDPQKPFVGLLLTDIPTAPFEKQLSADLRESLIWWLVIILVVVLVVNFGMNRFVLRPVENLVAAMQGFGQGKLTQPVDEGGSDEIGKLAQAFNAMSIQVEKRSAENQALSENLQRQTSQRGELLKRLMTAQEDERKRLARELHDVLGQALSGLALQNRVIQNLIPTDADQAIEALEQTQALISDTTDQMYDLIYALRPSILDDLGLVAAMRAHAGRCLSGTGISFHLDDEGLMTRLPPEAETALYRIFQEALTNVVRHAKATRVEVILTCKNSHVEAEIQDNGQGFSMENIKVDGNMSRGLGFMGMQERAAVIGASLRVASQPGQGTRICIVVPLSEKRNDEQPDSSINR